jgi:hypothetical protein
LTVIPVSWQNRSYFEKYERYGSDHVVTVIVPKCVIIGDSGDTNVPPNVLLNIVAKRQFGKKRWTTGYYQQYPNCNPN